MLKWSWDKIEKEVKEQENKNEYISKYNGEKVLVFNTELLKNYDYFQGMIVKDRSKKLRDQLLVEENMFYIDRDEAENNTNYKQIIPYCIVTSGNKIFSYQRSKKGSENRLHDLWSLGIGGHINPCDGIGSESITNACKREFEEEVTFSNIKNAGFVGLINDDSNAVNAVHFGVVFHIKLENGSTLETKDEALSNGKFLYTDIIKVEERNWENWSNLVLEEYIRKLN